MNEKFLPSSATKPDRVGSLAAAPGYQAAIPCPPDRACCCVARAVVRVVMRPTPGRPNETELLLCGHHYRVSRQALAAAGAQVEELPAASGRETWFDGEPSWAVHNPAVAG
jgi:hypothetical protein